MKVILQKNVKDLGQVGDVVNVSQGFARNLLFPRKLAIQATEKKIKEWEHIQKVSEIKKKKLLTEKQVLLRKINGIQLTLSAQARETGDLFGSITANDLSKELEKQGHSINKKNIHMDPIKRVGEFQVLIKMDAMEAQIKVLIEPN